MKIRKSSIHFDLDYLSNEIINIIDINNELIGTIINLPIQSEQN